MRDFKRASAAEKIILSIDTSDKDTAETLASVAQGAEARYIKMGLELSSATSWSWCAQLAKKHNLGWVADAKLDDIPNTVAATVANLKALDNPPFAITIHATSGAETMRLAQSTAGDIIMMGVTVLTSTGDDEAKKIFGQSIAQKVMQLAENAAEAGLAGLVCSPLEVADVKQNPNTKALLLMIPGTRSPGTKQNDQHRVATPAEAIKAGADLLVIGRQITRAKNPQQAFEDLVNEITQE